MVRIRLPPPVSPFPPKIWERGPQSRRVCGGFSAEWDLRSGPGGREGAFLGSFLSRALM